MKVGYEWSPEFFAMMYTAMSRRKAVEELTMRKTANVAAMTAALWANPNYDTDKNREIRNNMLSEVHENSENSFREIVAKIYGAEVEDLDAIDMNDPWWAAMQVPDNVIAESAKKND